MEDDWDLHAVVRGYTTTTTTASSTTTTSYNSTAGATTSTADFHRKSFFSPFGGEQAGYLFSPADPFEATKAFEELHELYKPFFPKSHSLSPQSTPISSLPSLAVSKNQTHHHQQQQQQHKQCSLTSAASTTISNSTTASSHTPRSKRRKNQLKRVCQVPAEGLASDVWAWRKYGQKPIKGSPYPRGYYRCSSSKGCLARKQVERNRSDPGMFIVTYTAEHNHPAPTHRNSLAGSTRKPFTPQTANAGDSSKPFTKPVATAAPLVTFSSSPTTSVEDELIVPQSTKVESMDDLVVEDDEEEDLLGLSDTVMSDDFFEGLEGLPGTDSGDCFSDLLPTSLGLPWLANNAATAAGGI